MCARRIASRGVRQLRHANGYVLGCMRVDDGNLHGLRCVHARGDAKHVVRPVRDADRHVLFDVCLGRGQLQRDLLYAHRGLRVGQPDRRSVYRQRRQWVRRTVHVQRWQR